ncbi:MAG: element excision factor XisI family protein [Microcystaceae cyanobacterium]
MTLHNQQEAHNLTQEEIAQSLNIRQDSVSRLDLHRKIVKDVLTEYSDINQTDETTTETALAFDDIHNQYLLILMGWHKDERIKSVMIHIRLNNDKVWIEEDWTEEGVVTDLLLEGIKAEEYKACFTTLKSSSTGKMPVTS